MITISSILNSLGNPILYKNPNGVQITMDDSVIYNNIIIITPISGYDATNTQTANFTTISNLGTLGIQVVFNSSNIVLSRTYSNGTPYLQNYNFIIKNVSDTTIDTELLSIEILKTGFTYTQSSCKYCTSFTPIYANISNNPPIANRGKIDYIFVDALGNESTLEQGDYTQTVSYCWCGAGTSFQVKTILTIRQIPNCGGTSPIVFQSIKNSTLVDVIEYVPSDSFEAAFACCVSEDSQIEVTPLTLTPNRNSPHNIGIANALKYDLYINNEGVYEEIPILEQKTSGISWTANSNIITGSGSIANPFEPLFLQELTVGSKIYTDLGILLGVVKEIVSNSELILEEAIIDEGTSYRFFSNKNYFIDPTTGSGGSVFNFPTILPKTGAIVTLTSSDIITGTSTNFTSLNVQDKVYTDAGILIGRISSITSDTQIRLYGNALVAHSGIFKTQSAVTSKGTYKLIATYNNACTSVSKEWIISICNSTIINTGTCNNPSIQNLSAINSAKFTIKTSNSLDIVDSVSQKVILKDQIVDVLSTYQVAKLDDGFYQLDVQTLDENGVILNTESQLLFYDCNIKSCEVYLRSNLLGFSNCVDCVDKKANQKEYETLKLKNDMFQIYKDIIYSYWNNIKKQQSIDETWDIEDHLQEVTTYSNALKQIKTICTDCGFSFNTNTGTLSSGDCGCGK